MKLVIIRHAKSLYNDYVTNDGERHLAPRGYDDIDSTAKWLVQNKIFPDLIITSPAIRAYSTAFIVANRVGYDTHKIQLSSSIYEASAKTLFYVLSELHEQINTVFICGHNPGFTDFVNLLCGNVIAHLPTAAAAIVEFHPTLEWPKIAPGSGKLIEHFSNHKDIE
jgi:phosphohistidine phosphatase